MAFSPLMHKLYTDTPQGYLLLSRQWSEVLNDYGADPNAPPMSIFACHASSMLIFLYQIPGHFDLTCGQHIGIGSENALQLRLNTRLCAIDFPSKLLFLAVK